MGCTYTHKGITYNSKKELADFMLGKEQSPNQPSTSKTTQDISTFTNYSGGAIGGDAIWASVGKEFGLGKQVDYKPDSLNKLSEEQKKEVEDAYQQAVKDLGRKPLAADSFAGGLVRRDYLQAKAADAVFAVGTIIESEQKDPKGYVNKTNRSLVAGGTGYAVQMAINLGKPVYVFDQLKNKWFVWENNKFNETTTPTLTKKFAGIGTREINKEGKQAIRDVYENTTQSSTSVSQSTQPTSEVGVKEIADGVKIIDNALTSSEEAEIFQMIKPFLESQGSRSNKGKAAPIMIGMGLRWDYKSNNPGKSPVEIKETMLILIRRLKF